MHRPNQGVVRIGWLITALVIAVRTGTGTGIAAKLRAVFGSSSLLPDDFAAKPLEGRLGKRPTPLY
jgi:hypothetical protein